MQFGGKELDLDFLTAELPQAIEQSIDGTDQIAEIVSALKDFSYPPTRGKTSLSINTAINRALTVARSEWKGLAKISLNLQEPSPIAYAN